MSSSGLTVAALRQLLGQKLGRFYSGTAASSGNSTTTVKDATVLGRYENGTLEGLWYYQTSGTDNGLWRRVTTNTQSASTITIDAKPTSEQSMTYELYPFEPDWMSQALRDAAKVLYLEGLLSAVRDVIIAVGNSPVFDPAFSDWTNTTTLNSDFWTATTSTLTQLTNNSRVGLGFTARLSSATGYLGAANSTPLALNDLLNSNFTVKAVVQASAASQGAVAWYDGSTATKSSYHSGDNTWAYLSKEITSYPTDLGQAQFRLYFDNNASPAQYGLAWMKTNLDMREYRLPSLFPAGPSEVYVSMDIAEKMYATPGRALWVPRDDYHYRQGTQIGAYREPDRISFDFPLPGEHLVRARGAGPVVVSTTDTDTVEIEPEDTEILLAQAIIELVQRYERTGSTMPNSFAAAKGSALMVVERIRQQVLEAGGGAQLPLVGMGNSSYPMAGGVWSGVVP